MASPPPSTADAGGDGRDDRDPAPRPPADARAVVCGTSMEPELRPGDVVTIAGAAEGPVRAGEIVSFRDAAGHLVTHRVLGYEGEGGERLVTQGDGRTRPDPPWVADQLVGVVAAAARPRRRLGRRLLALERLAWWELAELATTRLRSWRPVRAALRRLGRGEIGIRELRRAGATNGWLAITCTAVDARERAVGWQTVLREGPDRDTGRPLWLFFGLQVRLRHRGRGLGRRLLAAAEATVAREGGGRMYAFVRPGNRTTVTLFETSGWRAGPPPPGTVRALELASCLCFVKDA